MIQDPPATGSAELNSFLVDVKNAINTAAKPLAGWKLSDFEAGVSEVISDKRDLIDIVTAWDDLVNIRNNFETEVARYETLYSDSKVLGNQYQEYANTFSQIMEWWDQNVRLIEDIEAFMIEVNADTSAAASSATAAKASETKAKTSETNAKTSETNAGNSASSASSSASSAASSASTATGAASTATGAASAAASSASDADSAATRAESVAESTHWQDDRLSVMGKLGPSLKGPKGDSGEGSGDVLWAELNPLLADKAETGFGDVVATHTSGDFNALDLSEAGLYRIRGGTGYVTNMPTTSAGLWWNVILVDTMEPTGANAKLYFAHSATSSTVYCRVKYGTTWGSWSAINTAYSSMTYAVGTAASPTTTGYIISASILQQVLRYFLTGSSTGVIGSVGQSLMTANDAAAARTAIGAAAVGEGGGIPDEHEHTVEQITNATTVGRNVLKATDAAAARTAIGAGTSDLTIGTTSSTAKAGNYQPTAANITDATTVGRNVLKATDAAAARSAIGAAAVGEGGGAPAEHTHTVSEITDLPEIRSAAVADSLVQRSPTGNVLVAETPSGPTSATSRTYVETYVASQLGQAGSTIVPVEQLPANPDPTTFYAVMGPGAAPEPTALAVYEMVGTPAAGADFPGTAVPSTFGFVSNPGGWYAGASHGLTPPVAGLYTIKVTASPANGPVSIYPYVNGGWGATIPGTGDTATASLQLTTSDAVYYDVVPTTGGVPVTLTVKMYAGVV